MTLPCVRTRNSWAYPDVPEAHRLVLRGRGDQAAVGAEGHPVDRPGVAAQDRHGRVGGHVPQPHRPVRPPGREDGAVRAEGHVAGTALVAAQRGGELPRVRVPEPHQAVLAPRGQELAIGMERRPRMHGPVVGGDTQHMPRPAGGHIPDVDPIVPGDRGESPAVRAEGQGDDEGRIEFQRAGQPTGRRIVSQPAGLPAGRRIPEPHRVVPPGRGQPGPIGTEGNIVDIALMPAEAPLRSISSVSQRRTVVSSDDDAMSVPSGLKATDQTNPAWPRSTAIGSPSAASHIRSV